MLPINIIPFRDLGGIQTEKSPTSFLPRDSKSCVGGFFDERLAFTKRMGGEKFNTTAAAAEGRGLFDFIYNNGATSSLLLYTSTTYQVATSGSYTSFYTGLTANGIMDASNFNDYAWLVNGIDEMVKYNGATGTRAGIDRPATQPTATPVNGAGTLTPGATYLVAVTFVNASGQESNPCDEVTVVMGGADDTINLTNIPVSSDSQVTARRIYISAAGGAVLALQGSVNDNVTTTYTILNSTTTTLLEYDHESPPDALVGIEIFKERLFAFKGNVVYFSKPFGDAWYWPQGELSSTNFTFPVGNSEPITAIKAFYDILLIFKQKEIYYINGNDETDFQLLRLRTDEFVGAVSNRAVSVIDNYCYFMGPASFYRTDGVTVQDIGQPVKLFFNANYSNTTYQINKDQFAISACESVKERNLFLAFVATASNTVNNMCFALDINSIARGEGGEITADWNPWPGFTTQASAIVIEDGQQYWFRTDEYGFIWRQDRLDGDGGLITSTSTGGNTTTTLNDTNQSWTANLYVGVRVNTTGGTGADQESVITSNTGTQIVFSPAFTTNTDSTTTYTIGGIPYHYQHSFNDYGNPTLSKRLNFIRPYFTTTGNYSAGIAFFFDFAEAETDAEEISFFISSVAFWDLGPWDVASWDGANITQELVRVAGSRIHRWSSIKVENTNAGEPVTYNGLDKIYQAKGIR